MGLLDTFFGNADQTQALALLGAGLMRGDAAGGFQAASSLLADAPMKAKRMSLLDAQIAETLAQAEDRKLKLKMAQDAQARQDRLLFGDPSGVSAGAFSPSADGMGPTMPQGAAPSGGGLIEHARALGIPEQVIQADVYFNGGKKISEILNGRSTPKWENINGNLVNTNAKGFQGGFQPGFSVSSNGQAMAWQPDGQGGLVFGAPKGAIDAFNAYQNTGEAAKARRDPLKVWDPIAGREVFSTREDVTQGPQLRTSPPGARITAEPGATGAFVGDPVEVMRGILDMKDPQERANAMAAFQEQSKRTQGFTQGVAAGPSTAEAALAAGAKTKAEADARAAADRAATLAKGAVNSKDTLSHIAKARELLDKGPTSSGFGTGVDAVGNFFGKSTKGADVAAQLDTLSGWMVSNVPRMEGPQSNFDVQNYKTMAALVGDRTKPISQRLAALDTLQGLQAKYAHLNGGGDQSTPAGEGWRIKKVN